MSIESHYFGSQILFKKQHDRKTKKLSFAYWDEKTTTVFCGNQIIGKWHIIDGTYFLTGLFDTNTERSEAEARAWIQYQFDSFIREIETT